MVLEISQETFDAAVKENIELLGLTQEEAVDETVKQFEAQGVDLSKIVKETLSDQETCEITQAIKQLQQFHKSRDSPEDVITTLNVIKSECERGIQHKVLAGKAGAYGILLDTYSIFTEKNVRLACLRALVALMTKQPDLLDPRGIDFIMSNLNNNTLDLELQRLTLKWTKECCVMHEVNRQKIFDAHILKNLKEFLNEKSPVELIRECLGVCRALVLDDDVRVEFGRAHEHAKVIAGETLDSIVNLMIRFKRDEQIVYDLVLTLTSLLVRTEFCKKVEESGGLDLLKSVMETFQGNEKVIRQCFKLIKALAGNDEVKSRLIQSGYGPVICHALHSNVVSAATATAGLSCIAALTLRNPHNSKALFEEGVAEVIVEVMSVHSDQKQVQKTASWAIRNMVSRSRYQTKKFLDLGVEDILQEDLKKFRDIEYDIKASLRDLGCKVQLKEEWTGKGGALTSGVLMDD
ncbi:armadillo repeat-containing protein 6 homolog [Cylas formicarius]|uniref:armadillo repeat-containing protein 6 homolog n=1 Tax=Cylas formicarius TaxID=197179 RepID=UPI002958D27C|nr:armadillo repeat-containing protein 6 homolog [Cylas formicarius]